MSEQTPLLIDAFIQRWAASGAAERANYQLFLSELCDVLDIPRPDPQVADDTLNAYVFEKPVPLPHGTTGRIDLYKRGCFVLEAKQGSTHPNPDRPNPDRKGGDDPSLTVGVRTERGPSLTVGVREGAPRMVAESFTPYQSTPLAYFITFHTYGTWLPGNEKGSVDDAHNAPGAPMLPPDPRREAQARDLMDQPPYTLDAPRQALVLEAVQEVCVHRGWELLAAHVRSNHVHVVVCADQTPERAMTDFKAYASRKLNAAGFDQPERKRWTRHGSTRHLWSQAHTEAAINYVVHEQGEPMAFYENMDRKFGSALAPVENTLQETRAGYFVTPLLELPVYEMEDVREEGGPSLTVGVRAERGPSLTVGVRGGGALPLTVKERTIHEQGLVAVLRLLHDELDAAVAAAYGWPASLPDEEILQRLVDLNARRAAEEASGLIRWLRPGYQRGRAGLAPVQGALVEEEAEGSVASAVAAPLPWPTSMPEQARAVRGLLQQAAAAPLTPAEVAARFAQADKARVVELLETLASLGQAGEEAGRYQVV